jgi:acetyl-CoA synthetase
MQKGNEPLQSSDRSSLSLLGSVGEPINPEAWKWYYEQVGKSNCPIVDTWWQTETGGIMITPLPGATNLKPGSATKPFFGIQPQIMTSANQVLEGPGEGALVIQGSWPGQMRGVYKAQGRFYETYFSQYPGYYFTGDGCRRDEDGYYWITGRIDDVLNVSGHRLGTAEIESALVEHSSVSEAAVVGFEHYIKGQGIHAYVTLTNGFKDSEELAIELQNFVKKEIGSIAKPDRIQFSPQLPKTRSGKIMRRILRKLSSGETDLGDTSTLAEPQVVEDLKKQTIYSLS